MGKVHRTEIIQRNVNNTYENSNLSSCEKMNYAQMNKKNNSVFDKTSAGCRNIPEIDDLSLQYECDDNIDLMTKTGIYCMGTLLGIGIGGIIAIGFDKRFSWLAGLATGGSIIGGTIAITHRIFKNKKNKQLEKYERLMSEETIQVQKQNEEKEIKKLNNQEKLLKELNIKEDELVDEWPDLLIPHDVSGSILCTVDKQLVSGMTSSQAQNKELFYNADIDNNSQLDHFEIMRELMMKQNNDLTEEELLKNTLEAYKYYCIKFMPKHDDNVVNNAISLIKKYENIINNPDELKEFIENKNLNFEKNIKIAKQQKPQEGRQNTYSSDQYFDNPQNTRIEVFSPRESGPNQREWYVKRTESYPNGQYSTIMHKNILPHLNKSHIIIVKYNSKGKEIQRYNFYSNNTEKNANI